MAGEPRGAEAQPDVEEQPATWSARLSSSIIYFILPALIIVFTIISRQSFFNPNNFQNIAIFASTLLLLVVGSTFVIITAGIDLSVGSVLVFSSVVAAQAMVTLSGSAEEVRAREYPNQLFGISAGIVLGVLSGLAWGLLNGVLITKLRIPPFIVTLGTLGMSLGLALILSGGVNVPFVPPTVQSEIGSRALFIVPIGTGQFRFTVPVAVATVVIVIAALALHKTRFGRYTYAIGSNADAARRAGINVDAHLIKVYGLSGMLAGVAGVLDVALFSTASVGSHASDNLSAISAVVIGGTSLFGGIGSIGGSVVGAFIPAILRNGFVIQGIQPFWQQVAIGAILILAVYLDQRRRQAEERR
ncbi:MAG: ABC transporter permease [Chloroflexia bacterium]|nr:ABC transporter permease [Chloroflexia bacterium]